MLLIYNEIAKVTNFYYLSIIFLTGEGEEFGRKNLND